MGEGAEGGGRSGDRVRRRAAAAAGALLLAVAAGITIAAVLDDDEARLVNPVGSDDGSATGPLGQERSVYVSPAPPPPAPLPEPYGPPPADEVAARADVGAAFAILYDRGRPEEERGTRLDDNRGVEQAVAQVERNYPSAVTQVATIRVDEVRFLSPTEAAVRYSILLPGYSIPEFPNRIGRAVLVDGMWKVTRDTLCADLALGGGSCGP